MDEYLANIFRESGKILSKLQLLAIFFDDEIMYKIYLRSQVIHQLFESNPELDASKLEMFHLQFTASVIDLLKTIKKTNEKNVSLIYDEIRLNKELIAQLDDSVASEKSFGLDKQRQSLKINLSLRRLFESLSGNSAIYPFSKNMHSFSARYAHDFYHAISTEQLDVLNNYTPAEVYKNEHAVIQRKLMGMLCKYDFKTEFFCGLRAGTVLAEVYKFVEKELYFLYFPARSLFLFCDIHLLDGLDGQDGHSKKELILQEMNDKNEELESRAGLIKKNLPEKVRTLLADNYRKISDINFLQNISNFDVQANILKAMLNTDAL